MGKSTGTIGIRITPELISQANARGDTLSDGVRECLGRYFALLAESRHRLRIVLTDRDLLAACALGNGTWFDSNSLDGLLANAEDALPNEAGGIAISELQSLREKLRGLNLADHAALADAVERFWRAVGMGMSVDPGTILNERSE